ncbi:MAG: FliM/FliN family flagellar motor switch protein [Oscillospiraceae bacterium]|nr:FliM/FliN family flagellar motor switch protein [Oscillospiraceae bacterium]
MKQKKDNSKPNSKGKSKVSSYDFRQNTVRSEKVIVKNYDFKKPKKFTKEHLRGLNTVNEHIIRIFASNLSGLLRVFCEVTQLKIVECRYSEYLNTLTDKTLIGLVDMNDEKTGDNRCTMITHFPSTINFFIIDILLGGNGTNYLLDRGYTDIEIAILENFYTKITRYLTEAWKNLADVKCELTGYETNPRLAQFISLEDSVVVMSFQIKMREITDIFSFCLPSINLDSILREALTKHAKTNGKNENDKEILRRENLTDSLKGSTMELTAVLDNLYIDMQDIINLKVSDVIPLNTRIDDNIILTVEGEPKFTVRVGDRKIKKSVKICDVVSAADIKDYYNY